MQLEKNAFQLFALSFLPLPVSAYQSVSQSVPVSQSVSQSIALPSSVFPFNRSVRELVVPIFNITLAFQLHLESYTNYYVYSLLHLSLQMFTLRP